MKVTIDSGEETFGLFSKTTLPFLSITVEFSQEELAIVKKHKLEKLVLLEQGPSPWHHLKKLADLSPTDQTYWYLKVKDFLKGSYKRHFNNPVEILNYKAQLQDAFTKLKEYLTVSAVPLATKETLEF